MWKPVTCNPRLPCASQAPGVPICVAGVGCGHWTCDSRLLCTSQAYSFPICVADVSCGHLWYALHVSTFVFVLVFETPLDCVSLC